MAPLNEKRHPNMKGKEKAPRKQNTFCTLNNASTALYTKHGLFLFNATDLPISRRQKFIFLQHFIFSTFCAMPKPGQAHYIKHRLLKQHNFGKWRDDPTWQPIGVRC